MIKSLIESEYLQIFTKQFMTLNEINYPWTGKK